MEDRKFGLLKRLPLYFFFTMSLQVFITARELMLPKPSAAIGGEWRGMHRLKDQVLGSINEPPFAACISAPKHMNDMLTVSRQCLDSRIGEEAPAQLLVTVRQMCPHRERCVEQQYALFGPACEIPIRGHGLAEVIMNLFKDIDERGRHHHTFQAQRNSVPWHDLPRDKDPGR